VRPSIKRVAAVLVTFVVAAASNLLVRAQAPQAVGTWAPAGLADTQPAGVPVVLADGRTLIVGGTDTDGAPTDTVTIFDPASSSVAAAGRLISARVTHSATLLADGRVLVAGGTIGGAPSADLEIFNLATGESEAAGALGQPRFDHAAARLADGTVLIVGGRSPEGDAVTTAEWFDPETGSTAPAPGSLQRARARASATLLIDGRVLVAGGNDGTADLRSAEIYEPASQTFTLLDTHLGVARSGHAAVLLPHNNSVLIAGGSSNGEPQAAVDLFVPAEFPDPYSYGTGSFAATAAMGNERDGAIAGHGPGEGYASVVGGGSNQAERYRFATIRTDKNDYAPGELASITGRGWEPGDVTLVFQEDPAVHDDYTLVLTADENGNISTNQWAPEGHDVGVRFYLTAKQGQRRAQTTFTDGNLSSTISFDIGPTPLAPGATLNWTASALCANGGGPNTCASEGFVHGGPVQDNYQIVIEQATNATFTANLASRQTTTTTGGNASGSFSAPSTGGPYFYRARHNNQNLPNAPVAGNSPNSWQPATSGIIMVALTPPDTTPPVITPTVVGTLGSNGWYVSDVDVSFTVADNQSTITSQSAACTSATTVSADTPGTTITCSATSAGGTTSQSVTIKRDASAPNAPTGGKSPATNPAGWNNSNVTVSFTSNGDDGPSGVASCTADSVLTAETAGTEVEGTCTDSAGNVSATTTVSVKIDKTNPVITGGRSPSANGFGWNNTEVTVTFACAETGSVQSGITIDTVAGATVSSEGVNQSVTNTGACVDEAGNAADAATLSGINIDKTGPIGPTASKTPSANANGWNNTSPVSVTFTSDGDAGVVQSGVDTCIGASAVTGETSGTDVVGVCTDKAGNSSAATTVTVRIDLTKPLITGERTPAANAFGWSNTDVTVTFQCTDALSGLDVNTVAGATVAAEGADQSVTNSGGCTDLAGHVADSATVSGISIDKSAPNAPTGSKNPPSNGAGWNTTDVTVSFASNGDNGPSGVLSCSAPSILSAETNGTDVHGTCTDNAGNVSATTTVSVKIDTTSPVVSVLGVTNGAVYVLGSVPTPSCGTSDALSGVASHAALNLTGGVPPGVGTFTAQCNGAIDAAGNVASPVSVTYTVQYAPTGTTCGGEPGHQVLQPINFTGSSVFAKKGGSTVPAKFRVCGSDGVSIGSPTTVVTAFVLYGIYNGTVSPFPTEDAVPSTNADSAFRWSAADQQWIFNISLKNVTAGVTYVYRIYLNDGTHIQFQFGVK